MEAAWTAELGSVLIISGGHHSDRRRTARTPFAKVAEAGRLGMVMVTAHVAQPLRRGDAAGGPCDDEPVGDQGLE